MSRCLDHVFKEVGCVASAGNPYYEKAAVEALSQLWGMRSPLDLVGSSIDMTTGSWNNRLGGTGAGADSFYEYLLKAYVLFGKSDTDCLLWNCCCYPPDL